jgi:hypothetical protein
MKLHFNCLRVPGIASLLFCAVIANAQVDSTKAEKNSSGISNKTLIKKINQAFGGAATGQGNADLVTYGAFEPVNGQFKLNLTAPLGSTEKKTVPFLSVSGAGKVLGDNSAVLFNNSKFNSGLSLNLKIHIPVRWEVHISGNEQDSILAKITRASEQQALADMKAELRFDVRRITAEFKSDLIQLLRATGDLALTGRKIDTASYNLQSATDSASTLKFSNELTELLKKKESLRNDTLRIAARYRLNDALLHDGISRPNGLNRAVHENKEAFEKTRDSLEMTIQLKDRTFAWISLVGGVTRNKYYSFVDSLDFSDQFTDKKYTTYNIGLEFNFLRYGKKGNLVAGKLPHVHIGNIGLVRVKNNDVGDLSTTELADSRKYTSSDSAHSLATKYNVYTDPITEYEAWRLYFNYYYSFGKNKDYGLHFFPDVEFRNTHENPFNIAAGMIIPVKNKTDKTIFNLEFYGKLIDVGKALPQDEAKFINRNQLGISLGIPIGLPTSK